MAQIQIQSSQKPNITNQTDAIIYTGIQNSVQTWTQ